MFNCSLPGFWTIFSKIILKNQSKVQIDIWGQANQDYENNRYQLFPCGHFSRYQKLIFTILLSYFWYQQNKALSSSRYQIQTFNSIISRKTFYRTRKKNIPIHEIEIAPFQSSNVYHIQMLMLSNAWLLSSSFVIFTRPTPKKKNFEATFSSHPKKKQKKTLSISI